MSEFDFQGSDTLEHIASNADAQANDNTDINLDRLSESMGELTYSELQRIAIDLGINGVNTMTLDDLRAATNDFIAVQKGVEKVTDVTHAPKDQPVFNAPNQEVGRATVDVTGGAPDTTLVEQIVTDAAGNPAVTTVTKRMWINPRTGNNVANGSADVDGTRNVNGYAIVGPAPNPIGDDIPVDPRSIYPSGL